MKKNLGIAIQAVGLAVCGYTGLLALYAIWIVLGGE